MSISVFSLHANLTVTMPNQIILRDRLYQKGYGHFVEHTSIIKQLASKKFSPLELCDKIGLTSFHYAYYLFDGEAINEKIFAAVKDYYLDLIHICFKGQPGAMAELKERGVIDFIRSL
jgi:hypothetical protein